MKTRTDIENLIFVLEDFARRGQLDAPAAVRARSLLEELLREHPVHGWLRTRAFIALGRGGDGLGPGSTPRKLSGGE